MVLLNHSPYHKVAQAIIVVQKCLIIRIRAPFKGLFIDMKFDSLFDLKRSLKLMSYFV